MKFFDKLLNLMKENGMSVKDLGRAVNLEDVVIYTWKQKGILPSLENAIKIADYFKVDVYKLFQ